MLLRNKKGFTLIELLVVIAIIGILASVVLVSLNSARQRGRDARRVADLNQVRTALELFNNDNNSYPGTGWAAMETALEPNYMTSAPADPQGTAAASQYQYTTCTGATPYVLRAQLERNDPVLTNAPTTIAGCTQTCTHPVAGPWYYCVTP